MVSSGLENGLERNFCPESTPGLCRADAFVRPASAASVPRCGAHPAFIGTLRRNVFVRCACKTHSAALPAISPALQWNSRLRIKVPIAAANHILVAGHASRMDCARHPARCPSDLPGPGHDSRHARCSHARRAHGRRHHFLFRAHRRVDHAELGGQPRPALRCLCSNRGFPIGDPPRSR